MEGWKELAIGALGTKWIREEQMTLLGRKWNQLESSFPCVQQQVQGSADIFPVFQMKECILKVKQLINITRKLRKNSLPELHCLLASKYAQQERSAS